MLEVTDQAAIDEYRATVRPVMDKYGARVLAVGTDARVFEGEWGGVRTMVIEFPDMDAVERWHTSDDYKPFLEKLGIDHEKAWGEFEDAVARLKSGEKQYLTWEDCR